MIIWDESMSTGVTIIDDQHKMLFNKFNELSSVITEATAREAAGSLLDFLQFYAAWHFKREENCMDEYKCPIAAENKQAHGYFLEKFDQFYTQWQKENMTPKLVNDTYTELENWLLQHVAQTDTRLRSCVKK